MPCSEKRARRPLGLESGGPPKLKRITHDLPKTHAFDVVCVGQVDAIYDWQRPSPSIRATGRGSYERTRLTQHKLSHSYLMRQKRVHGFQKGDLVRADVPAGKKAGTHVAVRVTGNFNIQRVGEVVQGIAYRHCRLRST